MFLDGGKKRMEKRFDEDEECRCLCIDRICKEYNLRLDAVSHIRKINNFIKTIKYLQNRGLVVEGYIDKRLLINPKYILYLFSSNISCSKSFFDLTEECIYMYYTTAKELYNIDEMWTHCICEIYRDGNRTIYDSCREIIEKDYFIDSFPNHRELKNKLVIAIKVRRMKV